MSKGDFAALLAENGISPFSIVAHPNAAAGLETHGTTVLAVKYKGGALNLGDRRATAAAAIMYDKAEKIIALDDYTLIALAGAYGRAIESARYLRHAFKYFSRSQLQPMSLDGKLQEISRALSANLPNAMSGIGLFVPILTAYDLAESRARIYFYDASGARFESDSYTAAGSGSERIRGAFEYIEKTRGKFEERPYDDVLKDALTLLDIASDLDSATGGFDKVLPTAKRVSEEGVVSLSDEELRAAISKLGK